MPQCRDLNDQELQMSEKEQKQFLQGFKFTVKYVGTMEVPRPISRLEIVSAMRRIRYDFKTRSVKKKHVEMNISLGGVHVYLQSKNKMKKSIAETCHSSPNPILKNPIHRIFYVSHDSKDTKIFSYIAKEEDTNVFKCSVFKALKKCQAGDIVKTIGQAFEVSHLAHQMKRSDTSQKDIEKNHSDIDSLLSLPVCAAHDEQHNSQTCHASDHHNWSPHQEQGPHNTDDCDLDQQQQQQLNVSESSTSQSHFRTAMNQKLKVRCQEIAFLKSQNKLLHRQLEVEMQARKQVEASTQMLISQNQELLCQVDVLLKKLSKYEKSILMKNKNLDLTVNCQEDKNEIKNSPDSGLNETSAEGSQHEGSTNQDEVWPGIDNEGATSTPEKGQDDLKKPDVIGGSLRASPKIPIEQQSWKRKSKMCQLFGVRTKPLSLSLNINANKKLTTTTTTTSGSSSGGNKRPGSGCSAKRISTQEKDQLINESPIKTKYTNNNNNNNNYNNNNINKNNNGVCLKAPSQSKSSKKFKLEKIMRKDLGDSTTELELSFGD